MVWEMVGAMCTSWTADTWINLVAAGFTAILAIGVLLAWRQLQQTRKTTNLQLILSMSSRLRSDEALKALQSIYGLTPEEAKSLETLTPQQVAVLETIEMLGEMVNEKLVDSSPVIRIWAGILALRCWYKLRDYIERQRIDRGTIYCENLEDLASRTIAYANEKRPNQDWIRLDGENIIDEISKKDELRPRSIKEKLRSKTTKSLS